MNTFVIKSLEQAKLLTDPFKLQLLERFSGKPVTTKQVADKMGEKAPRLYRHVDAMVEAGLLELVSEKPKRGTVERYYRAVASRFEVDPELFTPTSGVGDKRFDMVRSLLRETESELKHLTLLADDAMPAGIEAPFVMRVSIRAGRDEIASLRRKLEEWLHEVEQLADTAEATTAEDDISYAGLLAFYPRPEPASRKRRGGNTRKSN
jgi:hypothetical protein